MTHRSASRLSRTALAAVAALALVATLALAAVGTPTASAGQDWQRCAPDGAKASCQLAGKKPGTDATLGYDWT